MTNPRPTIASEVDLWTAKSALVYALAERHISVSSCFPAARERRRAALSGVRRAVTAEALRASLEVVPNEQRGAEWRAVRRLLLCQS